MSVAYSQCFERQMLIYFKDTQAPDFPTFSSFANHIGVTVKTLEAWRDSQPAFRDVWEECREIQRDRLIEGGLARRYDASFAKYILTEMFGFEERGNNTFTVTVEVVD